ncbi:MAG: hypothetical protein Q4G27_00905 [Flavobacteriaceae bacterium]|nr:hypothetical protein [Flavobacteriaceae bacterium]
MKLIISALVCFTLFFQIISCNQPSQNAVYQEVKTDLTPQRDSTQYVFWKNLKEICGNSYEGKITAGGENDTMFAGKRLVMHVRSCKESQIKIPFFVGQDSSRTWVLNLRNDNLQLKHDHRYSTGRPEELTMYGGHTLNFGASTRQIFPADQQTADMLPPAIGNVWWIDLVPNKYFSYNLRRVNTDRVFTVTFDLTQTVQNPGKPWGWDFVID